MLYYFTSPANGADGLDDLRPKTQKPQEENRHETRLIQKGGRKPHAPEGASPEDIVFYRYTGNVQCLNPQDAKADLEKFKSGMEPMEYDDACAYRDNEIEKISGK